MSKPHVKARGLGLFSRCAPLLIVVGLALSPLTACYAHASPDGVYVAHGGGYYYDDGYRSRRRYRDYGPRYRRGPDVHYYRSDPYYRDYRRHRHHHHHRHYRDRW